MPSVTPGFRELFERWAARPIRRCPGRYVLTAVPSAVSPSELIGPDAAIDEFRVSAAPDAVLVAAVPDGGVISYRRDDGSYLHTLNTPEGFRRKLEQLGIAEAQR